MKPKYVHEDSEFGDLVRIVASETGLGSGLVEKDYWVTHVLWALCETRLEVWLKGGTSLSKGFGLIHRFSEDLDLRIEHGGELGLPSVGSWTSTNRGRVAQRRAFYLALPDRLEIPGANPELEPDGLDKRATAANYRVIYPGAFASELPAAMKPFVLLEVGTARVTPFVPVAASSFVHDWLESRQRIDEYAQNRPKALRCVHPLVTLIEKLDAITRRYPRKDDASAFVRHYEDAAAIIRARDALPVFQGSPGLLIREMLSAKQIASFPEPGNPAFTLADENRRREVTRAYMEIAPMFWSERLSLEEACASIREWLGSIVEEDPSLSVNI